MGRQVLKILESLGIGKLDCVEHVYYVLKNLHRGLLSAFARKEVSF